MSDSMGSVEKSKAAQRSNDRRKVKYWGPLMHSQTLMLLSVVLVALQVSRPTLAQDAKPAAKKADITEKQLELWLRQFPEADVDHDGKLTVAEAFAYQQKLKQRGATQAKATPPTEADVKYGEFRRNILDFWQAKSARPTPVLINFHGGGIVAGDKSAVTTDAYLRQGVSIVSANYRFVKGGDESAPYPAPMHDGARVVQFVRSKAKEWNIDPQRIALTGSSAGAVISLWIAYNDDLADPKSPDPITRQSTRVACVVPIAGPTSLDPEFIRQQIGGNPIVHPSVLPFFGVASEIELQTEDRQRLVREASALSFVSADDPPTFQLFGAELTKTPLPADTNVAISIHHPKFGVLLKEKLDAAGVVNDLAYTNDGRTKVEQMAALQAFLQKHLIGK